MLNSKFGLRQAANVVAANGGGDLHSVSGGSSSSKISTGNSNLNDINQATAASESYVIAKYDYHSQGQQELSIKKGDRLLLLDDSRHWWRVLNSENLTGFVPSNYVKREKQSLFDSIRRGIRVNTKSKKSTHQASNDQSPTCPLLSKDLNNDMSSIPSIHEVQQFSFKKPYNSKPSDNTTQLKNLNGQPSHRDILVRELGPNFNCSNSLVQTSLLDYDDNSNNNSNNNNANTDLLSLKNDLDNSLLKNLTKTIATVKYNYKSQQADELSLSKGSRIFVLEKSDDGWWKGDLDGQVGWFPSNYVVEQTHLELGGQQNTSSNINNENKQFSSPIKGTTMQYNRQDSFDTNSQISQQKFNLASESHSTNSHNKLFNTSCLPVNSFNMKDSPVRGLLIENDHRRLDKDREKNSPIQNIDDHLQEGEQEVLFVVVALYSFQAQSDGELSFTKDERLDIIERPANDPDWWQARNQYGEQGLVPKNYVQLIPHVKSMQTCTTTTTNKSPASADIEKNGVTSASVNNDRLVSIQIQNSFDSGGNMNASLPSSTRQQVPLSRPTNGSIECGNEQENLSTTQPQAQGTHTSSPLLIQLARDLEIKLNLNEKVWYHGVMSRQQCDQILNAYAEDGDFLIRNSETSAGDFSVSLKAPIRNKHFRVNYVNDGFCIGQRTFDSLDELVEHYKRTPIYTSASGERMFLKKPYCR